MSYYLGESGKIVIVFGANGSGKTNLVLSLSAILNHSGSHTCFNLDLGTKRIEYFFSDIDIFDIFFKYGKDIVIFFDESNLGQGSFMSNKSLIEAFLSVCRHFGIAVFWIIQNPEKLIPYIRERHDVELHKIDYKTVEVNLCDGTEPFKWRNIPPCEDYGVEYETLELSAFEFLLDLPRMFKDISRKRGYKNQLAFFKEIANDRYREYLLDTGEDAPEPKAFSFGSSAKPKATKAKKASASKKKAGTKA